MLAERLTNGTRTTGISVGPERPFVIPQLMSGVRLRAEGMAAAFGGPTLAETNDLAPLRKLHVDLRNLLKNKVFRRRRPLYSRAGFGKIALRRKPRAGRGCARRRPVGLPPEDYAGQKECARSLDLGRRLVDPG